MLNIENLSKTYPNGIRALEHIQLQIKPGMFGLLGPNGAGKSTLMRTIATLQQPDDGRIVFKDIDVINNPMELRKILGYLPQDFGVYPQMSAEALLDYFAFLKGIIDKKQRKTKITAVLEMTNLWNDRKKHVDKFSGGMKQRFGIAQLLLNDPQLIIVDEPTAGLDPIERHNFLNILRGIAQSQTVIFSTHIVDDIKDLCHELAIINNGRVVSHLTPAQASAELTGKIWSTVIADELLNAYKTRFTVLSSQYQRDNSLRIRIYSKSNPNNDFTIEEPGLEDYYFFALHKKPVILHA